MRTTSFILMLICAGCASTAGDEISNTSDHSATSGPELMAVLFKEGRPRAGDALLDAVSDAEFTEQSLTKDSEIIKQLYQFKFQIIGTTDNQECLDDECNKLSLRRAKLVHEWLLTHGVPASRMNNPLGRGERFPITDNSTEAERSANRRAIIDFALD